MIKPVFFKGIIHFNNIISDETHRIRIIPEGPFTFEPGQFVTITVAPMVKRSYSIASLPGLDYIDLIGDVRAGGPGSQFFSSAKEGQGVEVLGPLGLFTFKETARSVIFWATGTGVVPFISMVESVLVNNPDKPLILNSSFKFEKDIFGQDIFEDIVIRYQNFTYNLFVSRPEADWKGKSGRVTEYFKELKKPKDYDHYMCGVKPMVEEVLAKLIELGVDAGQIHYEKY